MADAPGAPDWIGFLGAGGVGALLAGLVSLWKAKPEVRQLENAADDQAVSTAGKAVLVTEGVLVRLDERLERAERRAERAEAEVAELRPLRMEVAALVRRVQEAEARATKAEARIEQLLRQQPPEG